MFNSRLKRSLILLLPLSPLIFMGYMLLFAGESESLNDMRRALSSLVPAWTLILVAIVSMFLGRQTR